VPRGPADLPGQLVEAEVRIDVQGRAHRVDDPGRRPRRGQQAGNHLHGKIGQVGEDGGDGGDGGTDGDGLDGRAGEQAAVGQVGLRRHHHRTGVGDPVGQAGWHGQGGADVAAGRVGDLLALAGALHVPDGGVGGGDHPVDAAQEQAATDQHHRRGLHLLLRAPPGAAAAAHRGHPQAGRLEQLLMTQHAPESRPGVRQERSRRRKGGAPRLGA
jgi:hypothetical protein